MTHERIYLQPGTGDDATWCQDRINDDDIEYVRADLYAAAQAEARELRAELARLREVREAAELVRLFNNNDEDHYAGAERESLPLMARRPRMYPGQSACESGGVLYSVADTDEHGLPVVERTADMPEGAKYRQRIRANGELVVCHHPYLTPAEDRWGVLERIEDFNEYAQRGQEGRL